MQIREIDSLAFTGHQNNAATMPFDAQRSPLGSSVSHCHSLHVPYQCLLTHFRLAVGKFVELGFDGEVVHGGSAQMSPNHTFEVQVVCELVGVGVDRAAVEEGLGVDDDAVVVASLQPHHPGDVHEVEVLGVIVVVVTVVVVIKVGAGDAVGVVTVLDELVVVGSLHPNQPGSLQVDVELEELLVVVVAVDVVVSSKQPHHPGVLHVSVRVLVKVLVLVLLVVVSVPLLSKNFQL